jgi:hypothetical protein
MGVNYPFRYTDCSCNVINCDTPVCCNNCGRCQCGGTPCLFTPGMREITQKRIQNQVRISSQNYISNLSAFTIRGGVKNNPILNPNKGFFGVNQNQMSDRNKLAIQTRYVPTRGNSTKSSITANRPGSMGPAGKNAIGVDMKHNSYDRYLGRLKAKNLQASWVDKNNPFESSPNPVYTESGNAIVTDRDLNYFKRFSKINYSILGGGLCRTCDAH